MGTNETGKRGLIILRKSRGARRGDDDPDVLATHRYNLTRLCESMGIEYDILEDIVSGALASNPGEILDRALSSIEQGRYNAVICEDIDRLARPDLEDSGRILKALFFADVKIITPYCIYDPRNPDHVQQLKTKFFFADMELSSFKRRASSATDSIIRNESRYTAGISPFGYDYVPAEKVYLPNTIEYPILVYIFENVRSKGSPKMSKEIDAIFGKRVAPESILRRLRNPFYAGYPVRREKSRWGKMTRLSEEEWIWPDKPGDYIHPVTIEEWKEIQEIITRRSVLREKTCTPYWAGGILKCGECGSGMAGNLGYYRCYRHRGPWDTCGMGVIRTEQVHDYILDELRSLFSTLQADERIFHAMLDELQSRSRQCRAAEDNLRRTKATLAKTKSQQDRLLELCLDGILTKSEFREKKKDLDDKIESLETESKRLFTLAGSPIVSPDVLVLMRRIAGDFDAIWEHLDSAEKREILRQIFVSVEVTRKRKGKYILACELHEPFAAMLGR